MKLVIDMDGVLYRGTRKIEGADRFIEFLNNHEIPYILATNNSTKTADMYVQKLSKMGIKVDKSKILTSGMVTAITLKSRNPYAKILVIGEKGLIEEMSRIGWDVLPFNRWKEAEFVVVGMDRDLTYSKLKYCTLAINAGAQFVATNADRNFPSEEGLIPGAGSIVAALETATGTHAEVMGKPNEPYAATIKKLLGEGDYWVIGDRHDTDLALAEKLNAKKVLVLSGVEKEPRGDEDFVFSNIGEVTEFFEKMGSE